MALYPGIESETRVPLAALRKLVTEIFSAAGMSAEDAASLSDSLVFADLYGVHSHGTLRVPEYVDKVTIKGVNPRGKPRVVKDVGAIAVVDGDNSMGAIGGAFAMRLAIEKARALGVGVVAVRGSNHCGAMDYFTRMAVESDMVGFATTNALPTMAPWGGTAKILGINPLSIGVPAGREHPLVLDAAFSASSHGKIRVYHQKRQPLPEGWAFDRDGVPTTDTAAAIEGLLQPIGQYKGTGLALMMGVLSSLLSGAALGTELGNMVDGPTAGLDGHFFMALNVGAFEDLARFKERVDGVVQQIETSRPATGQDRIYAPGGVEAAIAQHYRAEGIALNDETLGGLVALARRFGLALPAGLS
ncbi:MAG: Ldh family oxidoreductase [Myxococcales bacterium]|nr:Ldh family oxidoreductase [Myxococcales bacterium]